MILYTKKFGCWNAKFGKTTTARELITGMGFWNDDRIENTTPATLRFKGSKFPSQESA